MKYYALLTFLFFEYLRPGGFLPFLNIIKTHTIIALSLFILSLSDNKFTPNNIILKRFNTKLLLFFLFIIFISILTSDVTIYAVNKFKALLGYIIIFYIILKQIDNIDKLKGFMSIIIVCHILTVIINPAIILEPETRSYLELTAPFLGDGNDFALSVSILLPFCLFIFMEANSKLKKLLSLSSFILLTLSVIGTSSRGGFLAVSSVLGYITLKSKNKTKALISLSILIIIVLMFAPPSFFQRMETIQNYQSESSATARIMIWKQAIKMAKTYPLTGVGAGHFAVKFGTEFRPPGYPDRGGIGWHTAHSIYFLCLGELGFPGIIFLLTIIVVNFFRNEKTIRELKKSDSSNNLAYQRLFTFLNASLIGYAVGGAFLSALYYPHLYIIIGLITSSHLMYNNFKSRIIEPSKSIKN